MTPATIADRVLEAAVTSIEASSITIGLRLGWWTTIAEAGADGIDAERLSKTCGVHPRYVREWLEAMGAGGWLVVTADAGPDAPDDRRFALVPGVREVLVDVDNEFYLGPLLRQVGAGQISLRTLERAYQTGDGLSWADHDPDMRVAQGDMNRGPLLRDLPRWVREQLPEVSASLDAGALAADVGCGYGWSSVGLATEYPNATVHAYDLDEPSVSGARATVEAEGLEGRVTVYADRIATAAPDSYALIVLAEMLHDVPDPVELLASARKALAADGAVFVADMRVGEDYAAPSDVVERLMYGFSLLVCLPDAMTVRPSAATGAVMRPRTLVAYANAAGFSDVRELPIEHQTWRFWALRP